MKKRYFIISVIFIVVLSSIMGFSSERIKQLALERNIANKYKIKATAENKIHIKNKKVQERVLDAWLDIATTFNINEKEYTIINGHDFNGILEHFGEKAGDSLIINVLFPIYNKLPKGHIIPVLFVSNDNEKILLCYKESDGTNVMKKIVVNKETLESKNLIKNFSDSIQDTKRIKGKPIKAIDF